jgi:hypothetical protein
MSAVIVTSPDIFFERKWNASVVPHRFAPADVSV